MSHTEAEAKTKWCPFARAPEYWVIRDDEEVVVANRGPQAESNGHCLCLASGCMAWEWRTTVWDHNEFIPDLDGGLNEDGERKGRVVEHPEKRAGRCGLSR